MLDDSIRFSIDTTLSWDGVFPDTPDRDYYVDVTAPNGDHGTVHVSGRYTQAMDATDAASIAVGAWDERYASPGGLTFLADVTAPDGRTYQLRVVLTNDGECTVYPEAA